ncbi:MAG TPA: hypothetical protein VFZ91_12265, partial [Allosphingosinicella sp.]
RLQTIGAISIAWNWIEGAIDVSLSVALNLHPSMWNEVTTRINGLDSKFALIKKHASLYLDGLGPFFDQARDMITGTVGAVRAAKKLRDGVIHIRLTLPEAVTGDLPVGKGQLHEVLVSQEALDGLYRLLLNLAREMDEVVAIFYNHWLTVHASTQEKRRRGAEVFRESLARLRDLQAKRAAFPPLPEFPDPPATPPETEAAPEPQG